MHIQIDDLSIKFDTNDLALYLYAHNMKILGKQQELEIILPQATITYRLPDLLYLHTNPHSLTLQNIDFFMGHTASNNNTGYIDVDQIIATAVDLVKNNGIFEQVSLQNSNAKIHFMNNVLDVLIPNIKIIKTAYESSEVLQTDIHLSIQSQSHDQNNIQTTKLTRYNS